ncbi:uncharacterized protein LOC112085376 [Eutrema salsugineum]|uniref:uncharacterized protein LOC112085376 n=1 Tax=Eutrema salsugineum TaxID=72664 RepID=UPI000CED7937|nr:uncharacterized protein LOC112085376 [Eutrema salsugineum]
MNIDSAISQLNGLVSYFQKFRDTGFERAKSEAILLAESMDIEAVFQENFRISYFIQLMDQALYSLRQARFEQFQKYGCLYRKELFKVEIDKVVPPINYVTRYVE